eukprot:gene25973-31798_t
MASFSMRAKILVNAATAEATSFKQSLGGNPEPAVEGSRHSNMGDGQVEGAAPSSAQADILDLVTTNSATPEVGVSPVRQEQVVMVLLAALEERVSPARRLRGLKEPSAVLGMEARHQAAPARS